MPAPSPTAAASILAWRLRARRPPRRSILRRLRRARASRIVLALALAVAAWSLAFPSTTTPPPGIAPDGRDPSAPVLGAEERGVLITPAAPIVPTIPGDHVDLIVMTYDTIDASSATAGKVLVSDVRVIRITDDGPVVAVPIDLAAQVAAASTQGLLTLILNPSR